VVTLLAGVLVARFVTRDDGPSEWDARVLGLVEFVERSSGETFRRPVRLEFLTDAEFEPLVTRPVADYTAAEITALRNQQAIGRAFGWYDGSTNLIDQQNQLNASGILALYRYDDRRIIARTDDPTATTFAVDLRATLVHELVHALQDQRYERLAEFQGGATTTEAFDARLAVAEGHAVLAEQRYLNSLSEEEREIYFDLTGALGAEIGGEIADVPALLTVPAAMPYVYGPVLALTAEARAGGIQGLFDLPPEATDQVLDPRGYVNGDLPEVLSVPSIASQSSDTAVGLPAATAGITRLYLTLAAAMPPAEAWAAASGWGNDVYLPYVEEDVICLRWDIFADDAEAGDRLQAAFERWRDSRLPEAKISYGLGMAVTHSGPTAEILVSMCDPGEQTTQPLVSDAAVDWYFTRANLLYEATTRADGADSAAIAGCVTDLIMTEFTTEAVATRAPAVTARLDALLTACPTP
jgi:hypothetical protein